MNHKTKLQAWMADKGYSNRQLAEIMGFSYEYIYKLAVGDLSVEDRSKFKWRFVERFGWTEAQKVFDAVAVPENATPA